MRKIEQQMVEAVKQGGGWTSGNTTVQFGARDCVEVTLHGSVIAQIDPSGGIPMRFTLAGWNTNTTQSRVNALLEAFGPAGSGVTTKMGQPIYFYGWHRGGKHDERLIGASEWVTVSEALAA